MTGLNPKTDCILQIYCIVTDFELNVLDGSGWGVIVNQPHSKLDAMDDWCKRTHASTGLTSAVLSSSVTAEQAADGLLEHIKSFVPVPRTAVLAGNSVHADRSFLVQPPYEKVMQHLHYRILDVSSIKEAVRRWAPDKAVKDIPKKRVLHEAKADILESIEEARYYKSRFFCH